MTEQEVVDLMKTSRSEKGWNDNCDKVKNAWGGGYPGFWYSAIVLSGVAKQTLEAFGSSADMTVSSIKSRPIPNLNNWERPTVMPNLADGEYVVATYSKGLGDKRAKCESLEEMQGVYDQYAGGWLLTLRWSIELHTEIVLK